MMDLLQDGFNIEQFTNNIFYVYLALVLFDIITGTLVAIKEKNLNSSINLTGLIRKIGGITAIAFLTFLDVYLQVDGKIVSIGVGGLILYEAMSNIENFGKLGIDLKGVTKYFDNSKTGKGDSK